MISIVGNIKINDLQRLKYLKATLWSFEILKEYQLLLNIDCDCITLDEITVEVEKIGFKNYQLSNESGNYGEIYCKLLDLVNSDYVINFFEDAFLLLENKSEFEGIINTMYITSAEICKSSFFEIEHNSIKGKHGFNHYAKWFINNEENFKDYQKYYGVRFYIGTNFITTLDFAKKFWSRKFDSTTPHKWEIAKFDINFKHSCIIPNKEVFASIDDAHGCENSNLLARPNEKKFWNIYNNI